MRYNEDNEEDEKLPAPLCFHNAIDARYADGQVRDTPTTHPSLRIAAPFGW